MRRFVLVAALMGLTACGGGEMLPEETQEQVSEESICSNTWECACAKNKTQATCNASLSRCVWYNNRCQPTYE